jgi:hypothetical protein
MMTVDRFIEVKNIKFVISFQDLMFCYLEKYFLSISTNILNYLCLFLIFNDFFFQTIFLTIDKFAFVLKLIAFILITFSLRMFAILLLKLK